MKVEFVERAGGVLVKKCFRLDQRRVAELFRVEVPTISHHLKEIPASGKLGGIQLFENSEEFDATGSRREAGSRIPTTPTRSSRSDTVLVRFGSRRQG